MSGAPFVAEETEVVLAGHECMLASWALIQFHNESCSKEKFEGMLWCRSSDGCVWSTGVCGIWTHTCIHTLTLAHLVTHCCCRSLEERSGPSVISPGRSGGVSRATSLRPYSKIGLHGYFESQPWALEDAREKGCELLSWRGFWLDWVKGGTRIFNS